MSKSGSGNGHPQTIGRFLFEYIHRKGVKHAFGLPGDFALPTFAWLEQSKIECVTMTHEPSVGFAADAYARVNGLGLACVTYCVGGLNMLNSIAGAYAERSPVIVISGGPSAKDREGDPLLHHKVKTFDTQRRIYAEVTCANTILLDPRTAAAEIARVVDAVIEHCRPGYIEVPYDVVGEPIVPFEPVPTVRRATDQESLREAIAECTEMINHAKNPVILAGVELHRFKLTDIALAVAEKFNIPIAATLLSKSVIRENHPLYIGVYSGALSEPPCREYVDKSDCVIMLGTFITDMFLGMNTAQLSRSSSILATSEQTRVRFHRYDGIVFGDFLGALEKAKIKKRGKFENPNPVSEPVPLKKSELHDPLRSADVFRILSLHIDDNSAVVTDVGDSLFGAIGLRTGKRNEFIAGAYYCSMGLAVPGTIGVCMADPTKRVFGIVGDGAFQMTGMELSTAAQLGIGPVILLLNNDGYGTQRFILDGKFNDIRMWDYVKVCDVIRAGEPDVVETKGQLDGALRKAVSSNKISLIEIRLDRLDRSAPLKTLTDEMAKLRNPATRTPPGKSSGKKIVVKK
jgi:indolepyruvate decarboxylase